MKFVVITRVPDPKKEGGNLAAPEVYKLDGGVHPLMPHLLVGAACPQGGSPVFTLGEVLLCGDAGREMVGAQRKPSKWDIDYEEFPWTETGLNAALARGIEVAG